LERTNADKGNTSFGKVLEDYATPQVSFIFRRIRFTENSIDALSLVQFKSSAEPNVTSDPCTLYGVRRNVIESA
jgi:hypothetical protein